MKKLLRNLTLAALVASPAFNAYADVELTQVYYGKSATIGESWVNATNPGMNARFATGRDGKFYTIDMAKKAIISFEATPSADGSLEPTEVSEPTVVKTFELPEGVVVAGSSLSFDSEGNFIFNFNFVQSNPSPSQAWGMYNPTTNKLYYYTIPADDCLVQRIDHMGRAVGNAASADGAYGYAFGATAKYPVVYHFTTKDDVFNVTCEPLTDGIEIEDYEMGANGWAQPAFNTAAEMAAAPTTSYYATATKSSICTIENGKVVYPGVNPNDYGIHIGNSINNGFDTFTLNGKRYFVRSFNNIKDWWDPHYPTSYFVILNFAIFNEEGNIVAEWQNSEWKKSNSGYASITAEKVDDTTVNIYAYISGGKTDGSECVLCTFTDEDGEAPAPDVPAHGLKGEGTETDPYIIATSQDLCNAHLAIPQEVAGPVVYFKQTADIDMAGITDWQALNGWYGSYAGQLNYDGDNHIIYNFAPVDGDEIPNDPNGGHCYDTSIFGVLKGTVKNLGVVNANIEDLVTNAEENPDGFDGAGIIACYAGHEGVEANIENVFVIGTVKSKLKRAGGMFATAGANTNIKNAYAVVTLEGPAGKTAGIIGNTGDKTFNIEGGYVSVTDIEGSTSNLIAGGSGTVVIPAFSFEAYGQGALFASGITCETKSDIMYDEEMGNFAISGIQMEMPSLFGDKKMLGGYPTFNWVTDAQIEGPAETPEADGTEDNPYIIATADDLANAWTKMEAGKVIYFKQTADIDMTGVTDYHAINGFNGVYTSAIVYDGQNHIINNFAPASKAVGEDSDNNYYCNSVFGVLAGTVKNLGITNAKSVNNDGQGAAILGVYGGHGSAPAGFQEATIDNVFVTGVAESETYVGGMIGTTGNNVNISNSYAIVNVKGGDETAGLVSRATTTITLNNVYVAGTVNGTEGEAQLVVRQRAGKSATVKGNNVIALNEGTFDLTNATEDGVIVPGTLAMLKGDIQGWAAFSDKKVNKEGYPVFNWLTAAQIEAAGVEDVIADQISDDANAPVEFYNLQGVRVENPSTGLYIKRQGKTVTKVIIR